MVSGLTAVVIVAVCRALPLKIALALYFAWLLYVLPIFAVALCMSAVSVLFFYHCEAKMLWEYCVVCAGVDTDRMIILVRRIS